MPPFQNGVTLSWANPLTLSVLTCPFSGTPTLQYYRQKGRREHLPKLAHLVPNSALVAYATSPAIPERGGLNSNHFTVSHRCREPETRAADPSQEIALRLLPLHGAQLVTGWPGGCRINHGVSLFAQAVFYKTALNPELANTEPLLPGEIQG